MCRNTILPQARSHKPGVKKLGAAVAALAAKSEKGAAEKETADKKLEESRKPMYVWKWKKPAGKRGATTKKPDAGKKAEEKTTTEEKKPAIETIKICFIP
ncbi:hypothetical protein I79_020055 [Cricetulus griseus]|uniref:Uncharacterized protein n=1 Tax=Cricetulus griseus TaxID=10029 RepID=G3I921_CRIGR|nr:hypothetical protein I79_020055 [Cricetulus griseus]